MQVLDACECRGVQMYVSAGVLEACECRGVQMCVDAEVCGCHWVSGVLDV